MNILKVIVDELPVSCFACDWSDFRERNRLECQFDKTRNVDMFCKGRHDACPLMVDSEVARLRADNERLQTQNKQLLEVVGLMESEE